MFKLPKTTTGLASFLFLLIFLSPPVSAIDHLEYANRYYNKRANNLSKVHRARAAYLKVIEEDVLIENKKIALDRLGRLTVLELKFGEIIYGVKSLKKAKILDECMRASEYLDPKIINEDVAEYYYWKATCMSLGAKYSGDFALSYEIAFTNELLSLIEVGKRLFTEFDNGGFHRLQAIIYIDNKDLNTDILYWPDLALELINESIVIGAQCFFSYLIKAEVLVILGQKNKAIYMLNNKIEVLENLLRSKDFNNEDELENWAVLELMKNTLVRLAAE